MTSYLQLGTFRQQNAARRNRWPYPEGISCTFPKDTNFQGNTLFPPAGLASNIARLASLASLHAWHWPAQPLPPVPLPRSPAAITRARSAAVATLSRERRRSVVGLAEH